MLSPLLEGCIMLLIDWVINSIGGKKHIGEMRVLEMWILTSALARIPCEGTWTKVFWMCLVLPGNHI